MKIKIATTLVAVIIFILGAVIYKLQTKPPVEKIIPVAVEKTVTVTVEKEILVFPSMQNSVVVQGWKTN